MVTRNLLVAVLLATTSFLAFAEVTQRAFKITNECDFDVWVGAVADASTNPGVFPKFWNDDGHLAPGASEVLTFPAGQLSSSRIWGRTGCDWNAQGTFKCKSGDCGGRKICQSADFPGGVSGQNPVTLAEFTLLSPNSPFPQSRGQYDVYDISNVDGFNLPVITYPIGPFSYSTLVDPAVPFLNCGVAGECYAGMADWRQRMLENCPEHNRIFGTAINNACDGDASVIGSTAMCALGTNSSDIRGCASDAYLSSLPNDARAGDGKGRVPQWPRHEESKEFSCPDPPYLTVTCPANYHLPNVGKSPYKDWPQWFTTACPRGSYGFTYDDYVNTYACGTYGRSNAFAITFCPRSKPADAGKWNPPQLLK